MQILFLVQQCEHTHTYRKQSLNVFLEKRGDVLPVQDVR